ncbi:MULTISPECIES: N-acetyl-gamma-glutamyl-phosphate reductase [Dehalobacter]|jgi:N-acetyl-gamma-glutamyl-phosphate reductase|uniref:N-acetyl-gamma-glutamyl-phosphate reductase n=1 Tax=Dehalobacter restrictus TaxID=55583 RepID=A0A857DG37_9FIRM|nr:MULTISPECIES: N-acetyl-gamma-glutamyl-phosphate reductase [Dehalobacter]MCG1024403.1 N-acetyl-gamma-glutamyl-phosphate reductase [Dehalobacter sp.]MDJ0306882.1 N-acetyl-gamma-glutamyl-phosphate reductase [Dehalobacter sp.]QGZ99680.1 N-acetyl-gamma-glutamyl-phosphate reductase [Dehalobacter restrictus]
MIKVGILGATGYTGQELLRLLNNHPEVTLAHLGSSTSAGKRISDICPHLQESLENVLETEELPDVDVVFMALPHGIAAARARELMEHGIKIVDLGADFRLKDAQEYENWYKVKHADPALLPKAVYGLPELYRNEIAGKALVANPGCYPTASQLALVPLLRAGLLDPNSIIIDAKSGVSGAGRGIVQNLHYSEVNENFKAYGVGVHRHTPEIEQQLSGAADAKVVISFTPHLVPMTRGILATIYAGVKSGITEQELRDCWQQDYEKEPFIHVMPEREWPQTKYTNGSNHAFLQLRYDQRTGRVVLVSVIDNLVKGASGQAIQNMNILFDLPETTGLQTTALWP